MHTTACKKLFALETAGLTAELLQLRSWALVKIEFPVVDVGFVANDRTDMRIRMSADDYNDRPPAVELLTADGSYLSQIKSDPAGILNPGPHPATGRPFICMRGTREYHGHPSHLTDSWEAIRKSYTLGVILTQIWSAWRTRSK